jgi:hypothetical protein
MKIEVTTVILETVHAVGTAIIVGLLLWWAGYEIRDWIAEKWRNRHAGGE